MASEDLDIIVRFAERKDCEALVSLKKELALHQNLQDRPMLTARELERDGFDRESPCFHCIVAESISRQDSEEMLKKVVGYALYYYVYAAWEGKAIMLEDLCVTSSLRGKGIGEKLVKSLAKIGVEGNFARIQLEVLGSNESGIKFYKKMGAIDFTTAEGWHNYALDSNSIKILANK